MLQHESNKENFDVQFRYNYNSESKKLINEQMMSAVLKYSACSFQAEL